MKEDKETKTKDPDRNLSGIFATILIYCLLGLVGGLMLFMPDMKLIYFCYTAGGAFIAYGIILMIRYFAKKSFLTVSNYDFSLGLGAALCGIFTIVKAADLADSLPVYLGCFIAVSALIVLQHAIQLYTMKIRFGTVDLILAALFIAFSAILVLDINKTFSTYTTVSFALIFAVGILGIVSQIIVAILTKNYIKKEEKKADEKERSIAEAKENLKDDLDEYGVDEDDDPSEDIPE